jgi:myo-inositol 2-dehydrogenase/D-chiro-inositol 1-dehydrogenase
MGYGRIARLVHLSVLTRLPGVEVIALAEPDPGRRAEAKHRVPAARAFADYRDLLELRQVDAVVICLPPHLHVDAAVDALQRGKHVYLEKPLGLSLAAATRALGAWRRSQRIGMIGFNYRFNPLYEASRKQLQAGALGELVCARTVFSTPVRPLLDWQRVRADGGGALLDLASHHIDLVRFLFGTDVRDVSAHIDAHRSEGDAAVLQLRLTNGLPVQAFFSTCATEEERLEVYGQAGKLTVERSFSLTVDISRPARSYARVAKIVRTLRALRHAAYILEKIRAPGHEPSYRTALARFVAAVRSGRPAAPDFWDGYCSLAVVEAAEESARTGHSVGVADPAAGVHSASDEAARR